jgi:hypothetical protein
VKKEINQPNKQSGCLGFVALLILTPTCLLIKWILAFWKGPDIREIQEPPNVLGKGKTI